MAKKMKPGQKRCPSCGAAVNGPRTKTCPKCGHGFNGKPREAATNGGTLAKPEVNKAKAVRGYLKDHPDAMSGEIAAVLNKRGIDITPSHVAAIRSKNSKTSTAKKAAKKPAVDVAAPVAPAVVEKLAKNGDAITLDQIKKVAHTIKMLGGLQRVTEVLAVIKEMGGVKKFKDLAEAMTVTGTDVVSF